MKSTTSLSSPLIFVPKQGDPLQLFVLLHGESANPQQLMPLVNAIKHSFPQAMMCLLYGPFCKNVQNDLTNHKDDAAYDWIDPTGLTTVDFAACVRQTLPAVLTQIQQTQNEFGLSGQQTALAGFSQGATMALEASLIKPDLAGRVLAFSGLYASPPQTLSPATMLHFLHGENDSLVPVDEVQSTLAHLGDLKGDVTLDIASTIGHELHPILCRQAMVRLQTCVPLRSWEEALSMLDKAAVDADQECPAPSQGLPNKTLH